MQTFYLATILLLILISFPAAQSHVLNIVQIKDGKFVPDEKHLETILSKITDDTEIGVLSIAGEFRKGKSFILNFFLQYLEFLNAHLADVLKREDLVLDEDKLYDSIHNENHPWLRDIQKNSGFQFKSGIKRETSGINVWSEPLIVPGKSGKGMAVLLVDSQGLYDDETSPDDNVKLFTLVSLLSSTMIMNTPQSINSEQFSKLNYFLKYASAGISIAPDVKLFQNISFLIRDFQLGVEDESGEPLTGWTAGHYILRRFLDSSQREVKRTGDALQRGFEGINCFPLPSPGKFVIRRDYDGSLRKIDNDFLTDLQTYVVDTVDGLQPRKVLFETLNGGNFRDHVLKITDKMNKGLSPEDMARLQESEMIMRITDMISALVREHEDRLRKYVQSQGNYSMLPDQMIAKDIRTEHITMKDIMLIEVKDNATLSLPIRLESGKPVSGVESLRQKLDLRFESIRGDLLASAIKARNHAGKVEADKKALEKALQKARDKAAAILAAKIKALEKHVWKQCEKHGYDHEPEKFCQKGYCGGFCPYTMGMRCNTTEGERWDGKNVRCSTADDCSGCWLCASRCHW